MSENKFKKTKKEKKPRKPLKLKLKPGFITDPRFHLALGLFFIVLALFLFISFTSYLFTGEEDQSVVQAFWSTDVKENGQEAKNLLGLLGASLSYLLVYKWFGVASFLLIPVLLLTGIKLAFKKNVPLLGKTTSFSFFFLIWLTILLGYIVVNTDDTTVLGRLCGGFGFEVAYYLDSLIRWGTILLLFLSLAIFAIYYFDIRTLLWSKKGLEADVGDTIDEEEKTQVGNEYESEADAMRSSYEQEEASENQPEPEPTPEPEPEPEREKEHELSITSGPEPEESPEHEEDDDPAVPLDPQGTGTPPDRQKKEADELEIAIEERKEEKRHTQIEHEDNFDPTLDLASYKFPSTDLLNDMEHKKIQVTREELEANKNRIVETLGNYKIGIASIKATIGPTITLYEIVPEAGVKISKIKNLEDDIALSLAALGIRIIAPIPGRGTIGIEVPNKNREMVSIRSVLETEKFANTDKELPIVFGRTISNEAFVIDLTKMPHILMAGATGQGKSVGLNVILASLLYKKHPSQLKFVLVDPKKVELSIFSKIEKHFLAKLPDTEEAIITDTKKVIHTLNSLCIEMDQRYDLLKNAGCRNLKEYNRKFVKRKLNPNKGHRYLPYIVLVIDELADLMMTAGKEVETPIARLAQLARAIGIHLIVATQRPSVNVITGIIKANFPARISFKTTSKVDSRTILDAGGADQLIGMGDMLYTQGSEMTRLQCAFIDTPEVDALVDFIGDQQGYESALLLPEYSGDDEGSSGSGADLSERDSMFEEAARTIVSHQQGSTSLLQRKLKLGYNRAGRIIDQLEAAGIVGPFEGSKAREVYVRDEYSLEQLLNEIGKK